MRKKERGREGSSLSPEVETLLSHERVIVDRQPALRERLLSWARGLSDTSRSRDLDDTLPTGQMRARRGTAPPVGRC
jgi:hypothetical protein